jgi:CheY-like chemotaxis protein
MSQRIVIADDEPDINRLIAMILREYTVLRAKRGDEALALIRQEMPDLAILDISMPGLTGLEVAQTLLADPATANIPLILLSAYGQQREIDAGLATGVALYIVKPFDPDELLQSVEKLLAQRSPEQAR